MTTGASRGLAPARALAFGVLFAVLPPGHAADALQPFGTVGSAPVAPWRVVGLPEGAKPATQFSVVEVDGRRAVRIEADGSYGNLVHALRHPGRQATLAWQWRVEQPIASADLRTREGDDAAVKVCVLFDLPLDRLPFAERQLLRLARWKTGEPLPAATLCYVWDLRLPVGTALDNAYTRRMRYLVVRSGAADAPRWVAERRDVAADFARLFGDESAVLPPILGVLVGADTDNTGARSIAHVTAPELRP